MNESTDTQPADARPAVADTQPTQSTDAQLPAAGGSYVVDEATGALQLVQRTKERNEE